MTLVFEFIISLIMAFLKRGEIIYTFFLLIIDLNKLIKDIIVIVKLFYSEVSLTFFFMAIIIYVFSNSAFCFLNSILIYLKKNSLKINDINFLEGGKSLSQYNIDYGSLIYYGAKISAYKKGGGNLAYFTKGRTTGITGIANKFKEKEMKCKNLNIVTAFDLFFTEELMFTSSVNYSTQTKKWLRFS